MGVWYRTGTAAVTNGSAAVVGTTTAWTSQIKPGDGITFDAGGTWYEVSSVTDNTHLTLATNYAGSTASGLSYACDRRSPRWHEIGDVAVRVADMLAGVVNPATLVGVNATADTTNRLSVASPSTLFNHDGTDHRIKVNKAASANTASVLFQDGFSGRAEFGLTGDDDFHMKVSADGSTWREALVINRSTGVVSLPLTTLTAIGVQPNMVGNPDFQINQRAFAGGALTAGSYGHDRWKADTGGANYSVSGYTVTLTSGTIVQVIESAAWFVTNLASTAVTISVDTPSANLTITLGSVSGTITAGSGRRSVTLTTAAGDTGNLSLKIAKASAGTVTFGRVKAEVGSSASAWQPRDREAELALAYRYYRVFANLNCVLTNDLSVPRNWACAAWEAMRSTPTMVITGGAILGQHTIAPDGSYALSATSVAFYWTGSGYRNLTGVGYVSFTLSAEL